MSYSSPSPYSYAYGGAIPSNLARVHASVAHYCPKLDAYSVHIITTPSTEQLAAWVRRVAERTHLKVRVLCFTHAKRGIESGRFIQAETNGNQAETRVVD